MHDTALAIGRSFFEIYASQPCTIVEIGSFDVNGSLRTVAPAGSTYIGFDLEPGPGVDIVIGPGSDIPLQDGAADICVTSSAFEHDPQFWRTFNSLCRITRPGGYIYVNAPSNGKVHAYPVDCWRFYPDAGIALEQLTRSERWSTRLVESFVADQQDDAWNDFVAVFQRDGGEEAQRPRLHERTPCRNVYDSTGGRLKTEELTQDMQRIAACAGNLSALKEQLALEVADRDGRIGQLEPALMAARAEVERLSRALADRDARIIDLAGDIAAFQSSWEGRIHGFLRKPRR